MRLTPSQITKAVAAWRRRLNTYEIAHLLGCHESTVYNTLHELKQSVLINRRQPQSMVVRK